MLHQLSHLSSHLPSCGGCTHIIEAGEEVEARQQIPALARGSPKMRLGDINLSCTEAREQIGLKMGEFKLRGNT
ncbi:hypothetical protein FKM82_003644 [Ascaphus truei]